MLLFLKVVLAYKILTVANTQAIWPYSGHYLPTEENFKEFIVYLEEHNVDLSKVKVIDNSSCNAFECQKMK